MTDDILAVPVEDLASLQQAALTGCPESQILLGYHYAWGVEPDQATAEAWFREAAEQGHEAAFLPLAGCIAHRAAAALLAGDYELVIACGADFSFWLQSADDAGVPGADLFVQLCRTGQYPLLWIEGAADMSGFSTWIH